MSSSLPRQRARSAAAFDASDAPLCAAAGFGLAVLLGVPLWSGLLLAAWAWLA